MPSVIKRAEIAKRILVEAAQAHAAALAADKKAVRKIVARIGKAAASGVTEVKARKVPVTYPGSGRWSDRHRTHGPAWDPITHGRGLGIDRPLAETERRQCDCETQTACENRHLRDHQVRPNYTRPSSGTPEPRRWPLRRQIGSIRLPTGPYTRKPRGSSTANDRHAGIIETSAQSFLSIARSPLVRLTAGQLRHSKHAN